MDRMLFNSDVTKLRNDAQNLQPEKNTTLIKRLSNVIQAIKCTQLLLFK